MDKHNLNLQKCSVIITGAEGAIGRCISERFAVDGYNLFLVDQKKNIEKLNEFSRELSEKYGIQLYTFGFDLKQNTEITEFVEWLESINNEDVGILVNNAGINKLTDASLFDEEAWDNIVDTNLKATFFMSQAIGKLMIKNRKGAIINIASQHGVVGNEKRAPYCASKAGIINMSRSLAIDWAKYGIRVNCVSPGFVLHEKNSDYLQSTLVKRKILPKVPLARYCTPIDVAHAVYFLASSQAAYITGQNLIVDGGYTAQ